MTADEVRGVIFQKSTIGGYKPSDVDMFLDEVAVCIETMTAKIRELEKEKYDLAKSLGAKVPNENVEVPVENKPQEPAKSVFIPTEKDNVPTDLGIESLLIKSQKLAEEIENEAREISQQLIDKATLDAKEIIEKADIEAEDTMNKANLILAEAERKEESINAAARTEAENIINDAVARANQILATTREQLKSDQDSCDRLREEFKKAQMLMASFYKDKLKEIEEMKLIDPEDITEKSRDISSNSDEVLSDLEEEFSEEVTEETEEETFDEKIEDTEVSLSEFIESEDAADDDETDSTYTDETETEINFNL